MVYHAKSQRKKDREYSDLKEKWMQHTIEIFITATGSPSAPGPSLEQAIAQARKECLKQDKKIVDLSKSTLQRRVKGGKSRKESHEHQSWLTKDEVEIVVSFAIATSGSFLTTSSPLNSISAPPAYKPFTISPMKPGSRYAELLDRPVQSAWEQELVDALRESEGRDNGQKRAMVQMQAGAVLASMYTSRAQAQLQAQETQKSRRKGKRKMGDGKAKYFTGDEFFQLAVDDTCEREEEEAGKEQQKTQREAHTVELVAWKKENDCIREWNEVKKAALAVDVEAWEVEKREAKEEKRKRGWEKPKWKDYHPEVLLPRPKKSADDEDSQNGLDSEDD